MRDNMLIYRSFYEAIQDLPAEDQAAVWNAVFELGLNGKIKELKGIPSTVFKLIRPQIEANIKRYQNGKIPKKAQQEKSETEAKQEQEESKTETNKNKNKNLNQNKNIEERKMDFYHLLTPFVNTYSKKMLREFYDYWTEHGIADKKMRFEKEKSFGVERRLITWKNNSKEPAQNSTSDDKLLQFVKQQKNGI